MAKMTLEISKIHFLSPKINFSVYIGKSIPDNSQVEKIIVNAYLSMFRVVESPHTVTNLKSNVRLATVQITSEVPKILF